MEPQIDKSVPGWTRRALLGTGAALLALSAAPTLLAAGPSKPGVTEKEVMITTPDGKADAVLFYPAKGRGPWPAVIFWPDSAGLRPAIRVWARDVAAAGYVVLMPNAYYRSAPGATGEVNMADADVRKKMAEYRAAAPDDGIGRDAIAYLAFLDAQKQTDRRKKAGTLGYDLGGSYAFRTASAAPDRIAAVASLYGLGVATPRPNSPHLLVPRTKAAYYIAQSKDDDAREPEDKNDLRKVIDEGKLVGTIDVYPANHGWATPGSPAADSAATERGKAEIFKLLKARL